MSTYLVSCEEINTFIVEVEAQNEDEARRLVREDVNNYEVIQELVSEWDIQDVECINDTNTSNQMQTFIPGFHD
tara:strand:- start:27 stop:248 length:222 start_codon:yes stop_codon:yes gene_type:complete